METGRDIEIVQPNKLDYHIPGAERGVARCGRAAVNRLDEIGVAAAARMADATITRLPP